jgi:hypothetical protein
MLLHTMLDVAASAVSVACCAALQLDWACTLPMHSMHTSAAHFQAILQALQKHVSFLWFTWGYNTRLASAGPFRSAWQALCCLVRSTESIGKLWHEHSILLEEQQPVLLYLHKTAGALSLLPCAAVTASCTVRLADRPVSASGMRAAAASADDLGCASTTGKGVHMFTCVAYVRVCGVLD